MSSQPSRELPRAETPRCARDPGERGTNTLLAPPDGLRATSLLAAHSSQQVGMNMLRVVAEAALLHRLVSTHAVIKEGLIAFHRFHLALQGTQHERMRRLARTPGNTLHA